MTIPTLLIDRGDVASATALAMQPDPAEVVLWHPGGRDAEAPARRAAAALHARTLGAARLILAEAGHDGLDGRTLTGTLGPAVELLQAAAVALEIGARRLVDPRRLGPDAVAFAAAVDRINAVNEMIPPGRELAIDVPLLDLTAEQLGELADDLGVPLPLLEAGPGGPVSPTAREAGLATA